MNDTVNLLVVHYLQISPTRPIMAEEIKERFLPFGNFLPAYVCLLAAKLQ